MIDRFTAKEKGIDTQKVMKNLDILMKLFGLTKKEVQEEAEISSGYLTRLANPENGKNISMDLELRLEHVLDIPQFSLANNDLEYPAKEDETIIKALSKLYKETKNGEKEWKDNSIDAVKSEPGWTQLFMLKNIEQEPFNGATEICRKEKKVSGEVILCSSVYETFIAEDKKIIIFRVGAWKGETDTDWDVDDTRIEYPLYDFYHEVFLQTGDGVFRPIADDFNLWGSRKLPLLYAVQRLYNMVQQSNKSKVTKETMDALTAYLND